MLVHFFSAEGWQSWGLGGEPLIPERMPVLFDDDFVFEDEDGPRATRATRAVNAWLRTLPSSGAPSPNSWRAYALAARDWLVHLRRHRVAVFGARQDLVAALGTYADRRLSGPLDERLESSSWELQRDQIERRIRAAIDRLLTGQIPPGGACDVKTLAREAGISRRSLHRTSGHLKDEFEKRRPTAWAAGQQPDPREARITRLRELNQRLTSKLAHTHTEFNELKERNRLLLSVLAAKDDELQRLRRQLD
ncbi:hypothetical protein ACFVYE_27725 [Streptomyces sp. NPDC058239]|uniref:hypothetical protein n=1 Tax=Streptomyces sp. NPDC058239 TaxID=3346395 RepID=UPI0036F12448